MYFTLVCGILHIAAIFSVCLSVHVCELPY